MRGFGLGFTNPLGTERVLDVCLCLGCSGVDGVGEEWIGGLDQVLEGLVVLCLCELAACNHRDSSSACRLCRLEPTSGTI